MTLGLWAVVALVGAATAWAVVTVANEPEVSPRTRVLNAVGSAAMILVASTTVIASGESVALIAGAASLLAGLVIGMVVSRRGASRSSP